MALASKGKFCYFNTVDIKEHMKKFSNIEDVQFKEINVDDFKNEMKNVLISMGFIFFEDTLEHRIVLRRNGKLKEFGLQYYHIK